VISVAEPVERSKAPAPLPERFTFIGVPSAPVRINLPLNVALPLFRKVNTVL